MIKFESQFFKCLLVIGQGNSPLEIAVFSLCLQPKVSSGDSFHKVLGYGGEYLETQAQQCKTCSEHSKNLNTNLFAVLIIIMNNRDKAC